MIRLRLTPEARDDLREIRRYSIREFGAEVANAYLRGLATAFRRLQDHPRLGEAAPRIGAEARIYSYRRHRIVYRLTKDEVLIVVVAHQARDLAAVIERLRLQ